MLAPDTVLQNRYRVERLLAKGGMGAVYLARGERLRSQVALKESFFDNEILLLQFEREAQLLANLKHEALPRVYRSLRGKRRPIPRHGVRARR